MISLLLPSRNRPDNITRLWNSVLETATGPVEMVIRLDDDDTSAYPEAEGIKYLYGPRDVLSKYWNECYEHARGPIYMHCGDDIIFRTHGWDNTVKQAFTDDNIWFVHGDDGIHNAAFGTHGFIHKNWVDAVGYFVPPYFSSDYNDTWLNDVANMIGRRKHVPIFTEHMHFVNGKGPLDQTHQERLTRHQTDGVDALYHSNEMRQERQNDAEKLRRVMK